MFIYVMLFFTNGILVIVGCTKTCKTEKLNFRQCYIASTSRQEHWHVIAAFMCVTLNSFMCVTLNSLLRCWIPFEAIKNKENTHM